MKDFLLLFHVFLFQNTVNRTHPKFRIKLVSLCVSISSIFSLTHTGLPNLNGSNIIQHCWTLLKSVKRGGQMNPELWTPGFGNKIYPESLENKLSPCWRFQVPFKIINRVTLDGCSRIWELEQQMPGLQRSCTMQV